MCKYRLFKLPVTTALWLGVVGADPNGGQEAPAYVLLETKTFDPVPVKVQFPIPLSKFSVNKELVTVLPGTVGEVMATQ
jgi:hypothetical protein